MPHIRNSIPLTRYGHVCPTTKGFVRSLLCKQTNVCLNTVYVSAEEVSNLHGVFSIAGASAALLESSHPTAVRCPIKISQTGCKQNFWDKCCSKTVGPFQFCCRQACKQHFEKCCFRSWRNVSTSVGGSRHRKGRLRAWWVRYLHNLNRWESAHPYYFVGRNRCC